MVFGSTAREGWHSKFEGQCHKKAARAAAFNLVITIFISNAGTLVGMWRQLESCLARVKNLKAKLFTVNKSIHKQAEPVTEVYIGAETQARHIKLATHTAAPTAPPNACRDGREQAPAQMGTRQASTTPN